jgi:hypothetical protein
MRSRGTLKSDADANAAGKEALRGVAVGAARVSRDYFYHVALQVLVLFILLCTTTKKYFIFDAFPHIPYPTC